MDPEENLREQRSIVARINALRDREPINGNEESARNAAVAHEAWRLAELVEALDEWLKKGGFLLKDWSPKRASPARTAKPVAYCAKYEVTKPTIVDALSLTPHQLMQEDYAEKVMEICEAGYEHGLDGWYPDGEYGSDADWVNGVGSLIDALELALECDCGEVMDFYVEAHCRGLVDGGHVEEE